MMSRLRSESKYPSRMVMSCNPDPDHKLRELIEPFYLDEEGYPIPERDGVIRYFIRRGGDFIWGDSREELGNKHNIPEDRWDTTILSFTFISATIYDNPVMLENNPSYLAFLEGLNEIDKAQLLHGNWFARLKGANYWQRDWLVRESKTPIGCQSARGYDKASSEPSQANPYVDYTVGVKMHKCPDGNYYITGDCVDNFKDEDSDIYGRFRKRAGARDLIIAKQGHADGSDCKIVLPKDPGAGGAVEFQEASKKLLEQGLVPVQDPAPVTQAKLTRFTPFAVACEHGLVHIVESSFRNKASLEHFYKELEAFNGERSTAHRKDDYPDACASVFNFLASSRTVPLVRRNQQVSSTIAKDTLNRK